MSKFLEAVARGQKANHVEVPPSSFPSDTFSWLRTPASGTPPDTLDDIVKRANDYFTRCDDNEIMPTLTGLTLSLGLPSVSSIHRIGVRRPETRYSLGRCLTAIAHFYEKGMADGSIKSAAAVFMLKHLNAFDDEDPAGTGPAKFWSDKQEVEVHVDGYVEHKAEDLTPEEAYLRLVSGQKVSKQTLNHVIDDVEFKEVDGS